VLVLGVFAVVLAELVVAAAAVLMCFTGVWPGRSFFLGPATAGITIAAAALTAAIAAAL
jgi:hypothetical protein